MEVKINAVGFSVNPVLDEFIQKKISRLSKYNDTIVGVDISLKIEKDDKLENKLAEISVSIKGNDVFAKKNAKTFEEAIDGLYDIVKRQLIKVKEKERA